MEDEFGRPLSDDGQWVWDGRAWRPTSAQAGPAGPDTGGLQPTMEAPRGYQQTGPQSGYYQSVNPAPTGPGGYGAGPGGPGTPGGPQQPWYRRQLTLVVIIGALLVLSAVLVTVLLLTRDNNNNNAAPPSPSPTTSAPTSAPPTTEAPTTPPPTSPPPTSPPPTTPPPTTPPPVTTVAAGIYDCTNAGQFVGAITFRGHSYTTDNQSRGTYQLDPSNNNLSFTGGDLDGFTGVYVPSGPSMDLSSTGETLHCAQ